MNTKALRQKILDLAIRGKLVDQDESDEPASALIQRIREEKQRLIAEGKIKRPKKAATTDTPHYQNVPFEVPQSWDWLPIGEIGEVVTGSTPSKEVANYFGKDYPFFKPTDLEQGINTTTSSDGLSELGILQARKLPAFTTLVTCIGATIGKTGMTQREGASNQQINAIIPSAFVFPKYLYYACISGYMQKEIKANASATTLPILNKNNFASILFPHPPLSEQRRIVAEIERWFALIDKIERGQADLATLIEQAKGKILDLAIHGKLVFQDPTDEPAIDLLRRINPDFQPSDTSRYENLPSGWQVTELGKLCQLNNGEKETGRRIYLDAKYLRGKADGTFLTEGNLVEKGDYVILVDGENSGEVFVAPQDGYMGSTFKRLIIADGMYCPYVLFFIMFYKKTLRNSKKGAAIPHLNKDLFLSLEIGVPPLAEQQRIVARIRELFATLDVISQSLL